MLYFFLPSYFSFPTLGGSTTHKLTHIHTCACMNLISISTAKQREEEEEKKQSVEIGGKVRGGGGGGGRPHQQQLELQHRQTAAT